MTKKCTNSHYFDGSRFVMCPYCGAPAMDAAGPAASRPEPPKPAPMEDIYSSSSYMETDDMKTVKLEQPVVSLYGQPRSDDDDDVTIPLAAARNNAPSPVQTTVQEEPLPVFEEAPVSQPVFEEAPVPQPVFEEAPVPQPVFEEAPVPQPVFEEAPVSQPVFEEEPLPMQPPVSQSVFMDDGSTIPVRPPVPSQPAWEEEPTAPAPPPFEALHQTEGDEDMDATIPLRPVVPQVTETPTMTQQPEPVLRTPEESGEDSDATIPLQPPVPAVEFPMPTVALQPPVPEVPVSSEQPTVALQAPETEPDATILQQPPVPEVPAFSEQPTVALQPPQAEPEVTIPLQPPVPPIPSDVPSQPYAGLVSNAMNAPAREEDTPTVSLFSNPLEKTGAVGWLVCLSGNARGEYYELKAGKNFIGSGPDMDVILSDSSVARSRHGVVMYDPRSRRFFATKAGDGAEVFSVNGEPVEKSRSLAAYDRLQIGAVTLLFFPLCGEDFSWDDYKNE